MELVITNLYTTFGCAGILSAMAIESACISDPGVLLVAPSPQKECATVVSEVLYVNYNVYTALGGTRASETDDWSSWAWRRFAAWLLSYSPHSN